MEKTDAALSQSSNFGGSSHSMISVIVRCEVKIEKAFHLVGATHGIMKAK